MKAEVISKTELKLCRLRQTSPTAAHFSITVARAEGDWRLRISEATRELVCKRKQHDINKQKNEGRLKAKSPNRNLKYNGPFL